ncbi:hypothetical protein ACFFRR_006658 [Megaselia abdita]
MITRKIETVRKISQFSRKMSVLYMTGDKAKDAYSPISPYIDLKSVFTDEKKMAQNLKSRNSTINFSETMEKYQKFNKMFVEKQSLEKLRDEISLELKSLQKTNSSDTKIDVLKEKGKQLRIDLHNLKETLYPIESDFIEHFLELPNELSNQCPTNEHERVVFRFGDKLDSPKINHLDHPSVNFNNKFSYYLLDDVAAFEMDFSYQCFDKFVENGYSPVTNADFTKRVLTEAFGSDQAKYENIIEDVPQVNFLQLTGCGSMESFLGYFAKLSVFPSVFPLKLVSMGKSYETPKTENEGVFSAQQSNRVQELTCYENSRDRDLIMDDVLNNVANLLKSLGAHFKIVYLPVRELQQAESLCASIQMYSPYYEKYFEVGRISDYKDYISKRILFNFKDKKDIYFGNMIGGTVVNTSRLAMILIENGKLLDGVVKKKEDSIKTFKNLFL